MMAELMDDEMAEQWAVEMVGQRVEMTEI